MPSILTKREKEIFDLLIKNPAVFPNHKCVLKAIDLNIEVVNEMEIAYRYILSLILILYMN